METDLFGQPAAGALPGPLFKKKRTPTVPKGYAAPPGSGPESETCKSCAYSVRRSGGAKAYPKCLLGRAKWTGGPGSDIRMSSRACALWKKPAGFGFIAYKGTPNAKPERVVIIKITADRIETKAGDFVKCGDAWAMFYGKTVLKTVVLERITLNEANGTIAQ